MELWRGEWGGGGGGGEGEGGLGESGAGLSDKVMHVGVGHSEAGNDREICLTGQNIF